MDDFGQQLAENLAQTLEGSDRGAHPAAVFISARLS
jgi:hypothetical protein